MYFTRLIFILSCLFFIGCSSSSDDNDQPAQVEGIEISGTAEAPSGAVASYEQPSIFRVASQFFITPVAAALTGLEPIEGALVELIRVDNNGEQVGDVLATTTTSITGDYNLTLPTGVDLSGDLITRITGRNDAQLRAQVVEASVNITPVSEFILQNFVENRTDLKVIQPGAVVTLKRKVEEFDLVASGAVDIAAVLAQLEQEIGDYIDNEIAIIGEEPASADAVQALAGGYRSVLLDLKFEDEDDGTDGTLGSDLALAEFTFSAEENGELGITCLSEEGLYTQVFGKDSNFFTYVETFLSNESESFPSASLSDSGIVSIAFGFEEEVNPTNNPPSGQRRPAGVFILQQALDDNYFVNTNSGAAVLYGLTESDALDPSNKLGDLVDREFELFVQKPSNLSASDLDGDYGRVYFSIENKQDENLLEIETEVSVISFENEQLSAGAAVTKVLTKLAGDVSYEEVNAPAESGVPYEVSADGDFESLDGDRIDGFVGKDGKLFVIAGNEGTNEVGAQQSLTMALKLPTETPSLAGKTFRFMLLAVELGDASIALVGNSFNTLFTMNSESSGVLNGTGIFPFKESNEAFPNCDGLNCQIDVSREPIVDLAANISVGDDKKVTITIDDDGDQFTLTGWMNETSSFGIFNTSFGEAGGDMSELGIATLVEIK
jgi:hypothetical protein